MTVLDNGRPATLAPSRVEAALARVNDWLTSHVREFSPFDEADGERRTLRMQSFGEICLYLHLAGEFGLRRLIPDALHAFLGDQVKSKAFRDLLLSNPRRTGILLVCTLPWRDSFGDVARYCRSACRPHADEAQPFQILSHLYVYDALGVYRPEDFDLETRVIALSALGRGAGHYSSVQNGPYAFTHSAFYATRFGLRDVALSGSQLQAAADYCDIELCKGFATLNMDIALEMVLAKLCLFSHLGEREIVVVESAITLIEEKGYLRSPERDRELFDDDRARSWAASYHTMAVLGLVLMRLTTGRRALTCDGRIADEAGLEQAALAMDALGTLHEAVESGNLALAVLVLSKMRELHGGLAPSAALLAPATAYIDGMIELVERNPDRFRHLGMTHDDYRKIVDLYRELHPLRNLDSEDVQDLVHRPQG